MFAISRSLFVVLALMLLGGGFFLLPANAHASNRHDPTVEIFSEGGTWTKEIVVFDRKFKGGGLVALGDIENNNTKEIIVGAGNGGGANVRVFSKSGKNLLSFFPFGTNARGPVSVAAADFDHDGKVEIVSGYAGVGTEPRVRVHRVQKTNGVWRATLIADFLAFPSSYTGGVRVAAGNIDGGSVDIVVATADGAGQVRAFNALGVPKSLSIFPFGKNYKGGLSVALGDADADGDDDIVVGTLDNNRAQVRVYTAGGTRLSSFYPYSVASKVKGGVHVAAADVNDDGKVEIFTGVAFNGAPQARSFSVQGVARALNLFAYSKSYRGGITLAVGDLSDDGTVETVTMPWGIGAVTVSGEELPDTTGKVIYVSLAQQRVYMYENGKLVHTNLVSTGIPGLATPTGNFSVLQKIPVKRYFHFYGPGSHLNYDLPNTPYNLRFNGPYYLHSAYWHHNFGHVMSHGCVNFPTEDAHWLYDWAPIGTPVYVR